MGAVVSADAAPPTAGEERPRALRRARLTDVAQAAGVSLKTASRVLNDEANVAPATRERVRRAAADLGFRRNAAAADLARGGGSTLVGFVTGDLANPFYSAVAHGIERELCPRGLLLVSASSDEDPGRERSIVATLVERRVRALVVAPTADDHAYLADEVAAGLPVVFVDRPPAGLAVPAVVLDNRGGVRSATTHLLDQGHRRVGYVGDLPRLWTASERCDAFVATLATAGVPDPARYVRTGAHDVASARAAVAGLLALDEPPTALLAANGRLTLGALHALADAGLRPGVDVAVVGVDELEAGDLLGVSAVAYDAAELGRRAARLALGEAGVVPGAAGGDGVDVVPTRLEVRASSGAG